MNHSSTNNNDAHIQELVERFLNGLKPEEMGVEVEKKAEQAEKKPIRIWTHKRFKGLRVIE